MSVGAKPCSGNRVVIFPVSVANSWLQLAAPEARSILWRSRWEQTSSYLWVTELDDLVIGIVDHFIQLQNLILED
jgi:hypothetical protein